MPLPDVTDSHPLAEKILELHYQGHSPNFIANHCAENGSPFSPRQIKKYLTSKETPKVSKQEKSKSVKEDKPAKKKSSKQPVVIGLKEFTERFQIPNDLTNAEAIASTLQRMSAHAVMVQYACVIGKLEAYAAGEIDKSPDDQIKSLKLLMDCYARMWGIDNIINISTAMRTLETTGYRIDAINAIEESAAKVDSATLSEDEN